MPTDDEKREAYMVALYSGEWPEITAMRPVYRVRAWRKPNEDGADRVTRFCPNKSEAFWLKAREDRGKSWV